ncbi:MAG: phosphoadenosine phosphosulfate reductase family protein [Flavobacteriaceae bacterium]|nr:phosphoadenosine phosphosulfate reductase family protein [Flavobacteriaceae bacterium]
MISKEIDLKYWNKELKNKTPEEIVQWAINLTDNRIVTTSFGIYSAVLLNTFFHYDKKIKVIWCDTGYNTPGTYKHALHIIDKFQLNVKQYSPLQTSAYTDATIGVPHVTDPKHAEFTEIVKLEPFRRAIKEQAPKMWFTNIRVRQTEYRKSLDILSVSKEGILKVSPFYYWSDEELDDYLKAHNLPKNNTYFDPTKALKNRECGIHLQ